MVEKVNQDQQLPHQYHKYLQMQVPVEVAQVQLAQHLEILFVELQELLLQFQVVQQLMLVVVVELTDVEEP